MMWWIKGLKALAISQNTKAIIRTVNTYIFLGKYFFEVTLQCCFFRIILVKKILKKSNIDTIFLSVYMHRKHMLLKNRSIHFVIITLFTPAEN